MEKQPPTFLKRTKKNILVSKLQNKNTLQNIIPLELIPKSSSLRFCWTLL